MHHKIVCAAVAVLAFTAPASAQDRIITTQTGPVRVQTIATGLEHPWAIAFLPDGRRLVTERPGRLRIVAANGTLSAPVPGVPAVYAQGQGGLQDIALAPNFATSRRVFFTYAEPRSGGAGTAVARAIFQNDRLNNLEVIFRMQPTVNDNRHFGSRLVFARDSKLFVAMGERFQFNPAQDLNSHLGKIVRLNWDGTPAPGNPFLGRPGVKPEIWSYGHRNIEGAAIHPTSGKLWVAEMGPRGGDELNIPLAGKNYGWPLVSWGTHYGGKDIPDPPTRPDLAQDIRHWVPSISPSGTAFYTGNLFTAWRGNLLIGALSGRALVRLTLSGESVTAEERIDLGGLRIRDVRMAPDGSVYVLTDESNGKVLRLTPGT